MHMVSKIYKTFAQRTHCWLKYYFPPVFHAILILSLFVWKKEMQRGKGELKEQWWSVTWIWDKGGTFQDRQKRCCQKSHYLLIGFVRLPPICFLDFLPFAGSSNLNQHVILADGLQTFCYLHHNEQENLEEN